MEEASTSPKGFNLVVTHRDEKTGLVTRRDPYTLRVVASPDGGKTRYWERPAGSGNLFNKNNEPIGRWVIDEKTKRGKFVASEKHVEFTPPPTEDQILRQQMTQDKARIAELEKELTALRIEKEKKTAPAQAEAKKTQGA